MNSMYSQYVINFFLVSRKLPDHFTNISGRSETYKIYSRRSFRAILKDGMLIFIIASPEIILLIARTIICR